MKKIVLALTTAFALFGLSAHAENYKTDVASTPLYTCKLRGHISGGSVAIFVGGQVLQGPGVVTCRQNLTGRTLSRRVTMKLVGGGVGFEISQIRRTEVFTAGIGVKDPRFFYRNFAVGASAGASLLRVGIGADVALRVSDDSGFGFELGLKGQDILGLGLHLYGMTFSVVPR